MQKENCSRLLADYDNVVSLLQLAAVVVNKIRLRCLFNYCSFFYRLHHNFDSDLSSLQLVPCHSQWMTLSGAIAKSLCVSCSSAGLDTHVSLLKNTRCVLPPGSRTYMLNFITQKHLIISVNFFTNDLLCHAIVNLYGVLPQTCYIFHSSHFVIMQFMGDIFSIKDFLTVWRLSPVSNQSDFPSLSLARFSKKVLVRSRMNNIVITIHDNVKIRLACFSTSCDPATD